jgi:hypothetical protein
LCFGFAAVVSLGVAVVSVCAAGAAEVDVFGMAGAVCDCAMAGAAANKATAATPPRTFAWMLILEFLSNGVVLIHETGSPRSYRTPDPGCMFHAMQKSRCGGTPASRDCKRKGDYM